MEIAREIAEPERLLERFPGIEGFHFLIPGAGLAYLTPGRPEPVPEALAGADLVTDPKTDPRHGDLLLAALRLQLLRIDQATRAPEIPHGLELGYVLPADESARWHSATFCQHPWLIEALGKDLDEEFRAGTRDPFHTEPDSGLLEPCRSLVRGMDELMDHRGPFGVAQYFPLLCQVIPAPGEPSDPQLRVLNLRWSPPLEAGEPRRPDLGRVFECLARRLVERGTIDRSRRIENRFSLVE